jgi:hypothetical protein
MFLVGVEHRVQLKTPHAFASRIREENRSVFSRLIKETVRDQALGAVAEV